MSRDYQINTDIFQLWHAQHQKEFFGAGFTAYILLKK